jgi:hypothetical protein
MDRGEPFAIGPAELQFPLLLTKDSVARRTNPFGDEFPFASFLVPYAESGRPTPRGVSENPVHIKRIRPLAPDLPPNCRGLQTDNPSRGWIVFQGPLC